MSDIAFIGLGNMGLPMAANLVKAGHRVRGYDLDPERRQAAAAQGIAISPSAAEALTNASTLITMLPAGSDVLQVLTGADGLLQRLPRRTLVIDSSTIDIASARAFHAACAEAGLASLDAPVSGGVTGAAAASLTFMIGGEAPVFEGARPLLAAMGQTIIHCGPAGSGQAAKLCNNMILGISMIGVAEAFVLAERLGLSHQALFDVASKSSGQCWSLTRNCPVPGPVPTSPANRGYTPGFAAALMLKDLRLSQQAAESAGAATPLGAAATQLYTLYAGAGHAGRDFSGIIEWLRGGAEGVQVA